MTLFYRGNAKTEASKLYAYASPDYRQKHRAAVVGMFDYLHGLTAFWESIGDSIVTEPPDLNNFLADNPLPYFSIHYWKNREDKEVISVDGFIDVFIEYFQQYIIYWLSPEKRNEAMTFNVEKVWVAADLLALICDTYKQSPGVNEDNVRSWRERTLLIWKAHGGREETDLLYQSVMRVFDRLEAVAQKYPPFDWEM